MSRVAARRRARDDDDDDDDGDDDAREKDTRTRRRRRRRRRAREGYTHARDVSREPRDRVVKKERQKRGGPTSRDAAMGLSISLRTRRRAGCGV